MTATTVVLAFNIVLMVASCVVLAMILHRLRRPRPTIPSPQRQYEQDVVALDHVVDRLNRVSAAAERALHDRVGQVAP